MRLLVFVQWFAQSSPTFPDGDDRVRCVGEAHAEDRSSARHARRRESSLLPGWFLSPAAFEAVEFARKAWVVECESADAARRSIMLHTLKAWGPAADAAYKAARVIQVGGAAT
jgi:hypothetical protein